jgi:metal-responsive CopG/Arc/MetJ family transcriptional regulator
MSVTVRISFDESLLADIDKLARKEHRSRSELLRDAARLYIERRDRWNRIFALGDALAKDKRLSERDVAAEIQAHRRSKASTRRYTQQQQIQGRACLVSVIGILAGQASTLHG